MKKKPKAAVGDRYDVILTDGGDQKARWRESSKRSPDDTASVPS
jgi:hypothetical protein